MPRKIEEIEIDEISLVDQPANRKPFYIIKRQQTMDELIKVLKSVLGVKDLTEEQIEKLKAMGADASKAVKDALSLLDTYKGDFPDDLLGAVKTLATYASYGHPAKAAKADEAGLAEELKKVGAKLSKATLEELAKIKEIVERLLGAAAGAEKSADAKDAGILPPDVQARLAKLEAIEKADSEKAIDIAKKADEAAEKRLKRIEEGLTALATGKPIQKSVDGQEGGGEDKSKDPWPSL